MGISDLIAAFIRESLEETDGVLELQRSDLAERFNCVPSQINYVMSTRFSPEHGYIVESRRGGGGYIRIRRVRMDRPTLLQQHLRLMLADKQWKKVLHKFVGIDLTVVAKGALRANSRSIGKYNT